MRRRIPALLVTMMLLGLAAGPTSAASTQAKLEVQAGWSGKARAGRLLPVTVQATGLRPGPVDITASVSSGNGGTTDTVASTTAGADGTAHQILVVAAPRDLGTFTVDVHASQGGTVGDTKAVVNPIADEELVGVLPDLQSQSPPPATVPLSVPIGTARFVTVDMATLAAQGSLGPLGTIAALPDDLLLLNPAQQHNLTMWIALGGHLLVDADSGPIPGLPDSWQPDGPTGRAVAGQGEVKLTGGILSTGQWNTIEPTPSISPSDPEVVAPAFTGGPVGISIAANSGLRIPALGTILLFLLGYVLLAGPILFFTLNKAGKAHWAWILLPLLAIGFTAGGYVVGGRSRDTKRTAFSSSVVQTPGADLDLAYIGILSRDGGNRTVNFPGGWWSGNVANELYGRAEADVTSKVTGGGTTGSVSLVGGQFAVLGARGAAPATSELEVHALGAAREVAGTVQNNGKSVLRQVAVFIGNHGTLVGDLAPGQKKSWDVGTTSNTGNENLFVPVEAGVWPQFSNQNVDQRKGAVDLAVWGETTRLYGADFRSPGNVVAVGWSGDAPAGLQLPADAAGRTAVVARDVIHSGGHLTGFDVRRDLLRGPATTPISDSTGPTAGAVFRFVIPPGHTTDENALRLSVPSTLSKVDVWDGTRWQTMSGLLTQSGFNGPATLVPLPPGALIDGVVYVRVAVKVNGPPNSAADLVLGEQQ